ncbi:MAG: amino acid ABC transporter permease [Bdellovibrionales bacterium]|nr:amino acid ABC transporter permease [Bdellovibrionales bacterium]
MTSVAQPKGLKYIDSKLKSLLVLAWITVSIAVAYIILRVVVPMMPEPIGSRADLFIEGARTTVYLTLIAGFFGLLIGFILGLSKYSANKVINLPASFLVWVLQGTPLIVQILFVYYALPEIIPFLKLNEFTAACLALALNVGAYNAEVIRAGGEAIPKGQFEASHSLGFSKIQTMQFIILPQAIRIVIPPLINNIIALSKDSSLASAIGLLELTLSGQRISSETFMPVPVLTTIAMIYLLLTFMINVVTYLAKRYL